MKCLRCEQDNPTHARFCLGCGAGLMLACGSCGVELPGGARFCVHCGQAVAAGTASAIRALAPESYIPKHLAEKILNSKAALEGERKQVTVLFADLKGSMELLADRDPEEARKLLDPVLELMMDAVHSYEGTVNQVMGDGIMALFGAPLAHEDHAVRACYAALRMQDVLQNYAAELFRTHGVLVRIRVGLNSGDVVVRAINTDLHVEYTAIGATTHLAARMEQLAAPGSILLAANTLRFAEGYVDVRRLGPVPIKGMATRVEVYELLGASTRRPRMHGRGRETSPLVGREVEVARLKEALKRAHAGDGTVVAIVGDPGLGKTRLCNELARWAGEQDWLLLEASGVSYGRATPYLPLVELLRTFFGLESREDPRRVTEKVINRLLSADPGLEATLPPLLALLNLPTDDPGWQALDSSQRRRRTLDSLKRLWTGQASERPVCMVLENLHWVDSETQAFVDSMIESLPDHRVFLVVTHRPEYRHPWATKSYYSQIALAPLSVESSQRLARSLVGDDATLRPVHHLLMERAEGNPLFLEEMLRALVETAVLVGERGAYRLAQPLPTTQIPPTVQAVLAARMDRLSTQDKALLQCAAVIGKDAPLFLLEAIAGLDRDAVLDALGRLRSAEFVYETALFPELVYTFTHALTHEVAYATLLHGRRRILHQAVVRAIEARYPNHLDDHVDTLAHHAFHGELWREAATYLTQAGQKAFFRSAHGAAATRFREAIAALDRLPEDRTSLEQRIDVRLALRNALLPIGAVPEVMARLGDAAALAEQIADRGRGGWVCGYMSACHWSIGDYQAALIAAHRAIAIGRELPDDALYVYGNLALTWIHHSCGDYADGRRAGGEAVAYLRGDRLTARLPIPSVPAVLARTWLVSSLVELGEFAEAAELAHEAMRIAEAIGEPWSLADACLGLGVFRLRRGEAAEAVHVLERGVTTCRRYDIVVWLAPLTSSLGYARALSGRATEAVVLLRDAIEQADAAGLRFYRTLAELWLAEALWLDGRLVEATRHASAALAQAKRYGEAGNEAYSRRLLGELHGLGPTPIDAVAELRQALALATARSMRPLAAHCQVSLAATLGRLDRAVEARQLLTSALDSFRELALGSGVAAVEATARELAATPGAFRTFPPSPRT
jgi:class 3 adenylate cyclase/tetratricopeptide (TPR) repeat protein